MSDRTYASDVAKDFVTVDDAAAFAPEVVRDERADTGLLMDRVLAGQAVFAS